jgi:hypothetical protein
VRSFLGFIRLADVFLVYRRLSKRSLSHTPSSRSRRAQVCRLAHVSLPAFTDRSNSSR